MKIGRYAGGRYGIVRDGNVYDVTQMVQPLLEPKPWPPHGDALICHLKTVREALEGKDLGAAVGTTESVSWLAPIAPPKLICAPVNYHAHVAEAAAQPGVFKTGLSSRIDEAGLFLKASSSAVGPGEGVAVRFPDRRTDHEMELGVIIGHHAENVTEDKALDYVAGYCIALDMTVRGQEDRSFRKSIQSYAVLGPYVTTADEVGDPEQLDFWLKVNGKPRQQSNTSKMIFGVRRLIAWASRWYTLFPGDVIFSGTPEGVGPVGDGDVMECWIDKVGEMRVPVRSAPKEISWKSDGTPATAPA